jgi:hypothetical protein
LATKGASYFELAIFTGEKVFDCQDNGGRIHWVLKDENAMGRDRSMSTASLSVFGMARFKTHVIGAIAAREKELRRANKPVWWKDAPGLFVQQDGLSTHWVPSALDAWKRVAGMNVVGRPGDPQWRWPAHSCDLSPIENAWSIIARRVSERGPLDIQDLTKFVEMEAARVTPQERMNLCSSFKDRLALCAANGGEAVRLPHRSAAEKRRA